MDRHDYADEQAGAVPRYSRCDLCEEAGIPCHRQDCPIAAPECKCGGQEIDKRCPVCGQVYDAAAYWRLACIGQLVDDAGSLCLHNCECGNTLAVEVR